MLSSTDFNPSFLSMGTEPAQNSSRFTFFAGFSHSWQTARPARPHSAPRLPEPRPPGPCWPDETRPGFHVTEAHTSHVTRHVVPAARTKARHSLCYSKYFRRHFMPQTAEFPQPRTQEQRHHQYAALLPRLARGNPVLAALHATTSMF